MNGTLTTHLLNAARTGVTVKSAKASLMTRRQRVPGASIKNIRAELTRLLDDGKIIQIGQNVKVFFRKNRSTARDIAEWRARHEHCVFTALQSADAWTNFHQLRSRLAERPGSDSATADTTFLKNSLAALVAQQRIQMIDIKLPDADIAHYYRCAPMTLTDTLCPTIAQQAKAKLSTWINTHRPRFSLVELKRALDITSDVATQVTEYLIDEQLCVRAEGTLIPMFDAQARPGVPVSLRRTPPARLRRLHAPNTPRRAPTPRPVVRPTRVPVTPPMPVQPSHDLTVQPQRSRPALQRRHPRSPERQASLAAQHHTRLAAVHLQRAGPCQPSTAPPLTGEQMPSHGHAWRREPLLGRASPPRTSACRSVLSRAGPPSRQGPPPVRPAVT